MDLIHRDDIPLDVLAAFEAQMAEKHPGYKIVCAGDVSPDKIPAEVQDAIAQFKLRSTRSMAEGRCFDCGAHIPTWPEPGEDIPEGWELPEGWVTMRKVGLSAEELGEFMGFICPACDAADSEE
jgi:hypothetical protein